MVSKNGPSLKEAMAPGGVVEQALMYFFSRKDRKIGNVPSKFSDKKELAKKLDQICKWNLKVPPLAIEVPAAAQPANAESDEEGGLVESRAGRKRRWPRNLKKTSCCCAGLKKRRHL